MKVTVIPTIFDALRTLPKGLEKGTERIENKRKNRAHPDYNNIEIDQNSEKSPGDLRRLAVTRVPKNSSGVK